MTRRTNKLINAPDDVVSDLIDGMVGAHPDLLRLDGTTGRAIVAVDGPRDGKVGIVIGGGSGHEPLFSGYVGRGLADAAAVGNIFASPAPNQILDAARAADGGAGVLFLYGNYAGDVMNFDMAAELLAGEGIAARSVLVTDDVASAPVERWVERRGIAGNIFVFKIAGAAADRGADLAEVERLARHANAHTATMGVALGPCSLPQTAVPNFEIGAGEMEIGMGIHGEPGIARIALEPADAVTDRLLRPVMSELELASGDRVAVLVNGLGATPMHELYTLHRRVRTVLTEMEIAIYRSWIGEYATSLEMAGASITLMKLDAALTDLLDHPCHTLAFRVGRVAKADRPTPTRVGKAAVSKPDKNEPGGADLIAGGEITPQLFGSMMRAVADEIALEKDRLCELDGAIGDGDHGITMDLGWRAACEALDRLRPETAITAMCRAMSDAFLDAVGASAGPLYATALRHAGEAVGAYRDLDTEAMVHWIEGMADGIVARGGAEAEDKTMLDAWLPAAAAARAAAVLGAPLLECLRAAADAADRGALETSRMRARRGRAAKLGDRAIGHVDPGAASAALVLQAMVLSFESTELSIGD